MRLLLLSTALLLVSAPCLAAPLAAPALHWVRVPGAETCVAPRALSERVETLLGAPLARAAEAEHTIEGSVEPTQHTFRVRLRLRDRDARLLGERNLAQSKQDCSALTEPLAFVIAMMIDPEVVAHGLPPSVLALLGEDAPELRLLDQLKREPAQPVALAMSERVHTASAPPAKPPNASAPPTRGQVLLSIGSTFLQGTRPLLTGEWLGMMAVAPRIAVGASAWAGAALREQPVSQGRSFRLTMFGFEALLCLAPRSGARVGIGACLGPALRLHHAAGRGFGRDRSTTLVSGSAVANVQVRVRVGGGWGIAALLGAAVAFSRRQLVYADADATRYDVQRFSLFNLSAGLGPSFEF